MAERYGVAAPFLVVGVTALGAAVYALLRVIFGWTDASRAAHEPQRVFELAALGRVSEAERARDLSIDFFRKHLD